MSNAGNASKMLLKALDENDKEYMANLIAIAQTYALLDIADALRSFE